MWHNLSQEQKQAFDQLVNIASQKIFNFLFQQGVRHVQPGQAPSSPASNPPPGVDAFDSLSKAVSVVRNRGRGNQRETTTAAQLLAEIADSMQIMKQAQETLLDVLLEEDEEPPRKRKRRRS